MKYNSYHEDEIGVILLGMPVKYLSFVETHTTIIISYKSLP